MKKKFFARATIAAAMALGVQTANAALIFSDISMTSNSLTFTVNGDFSGYPTVPSNYLNQFSILYSGDLWLGPQGDYSPNTWSGSLFDGLAIDNGGNTGMFSSNPQAYSWSRYNSSLAGAVATNNTVTLDFGSNYFNPSATGSIEFVWGNGYSVSNHSSVETIVDPGQPVVSAVVSTPATLGLFSAALACLGLVRPARRSSRQISDVGHTTKA